MHAQHVQQARSSSARRVRRPITPSASCTRRAVSTGAARMVFAGGAPAPRWRQGRRRACTPYASRSRRVHTLERPAPQQGRTDLAIRNVEISIDSIDSIDSIGDPVEGAKVAQRIQRNTAREPSAPTNPRHAAMPRVTATAGPKYGAPTARRPHADRTPTARRPHADGGTAA